MPARRSRPCRCLAFLSYLFGGITVLMLVVAAATPSHRALILYTTVSVIAAAACGLCIMGWMFRKWVMPLSVAWNLAAREAQRQAVERREHLTPVGGEGSLRPAR